jgi:Calx-beta domain/ZU5 domain
MNVAATTRFLGAIFLALMFAACGGGGGGGGGGSTTPASSAIIGAAGGTVTHASGAQVVIPAGALAGDTTISIEQIAASTTALPAGFSVSGQIFAFTPHGTTFAVPVTMTLPFNPALVPAGSTPQFFKTNAQFQWEQITNATFGADTATAQVTSFSDAAVVTLPPITLEDRGPVRVWSFSEFRTDALEEVEVATDTQIGGILEENFDFGSANFDYPVVFLDGALLPEDGIATGQIASTADGVTYWVGSEAPIGNPVLEEPIGSKARLVQFQTYTKNAADATYKFTLTEAFVEGFDGNSVLGRVCPSIHELGAGICDLIKAEIYLDVKAFSNDPNTPKVTFFRTAGGASVQGGATANLITGNGAFWFNDVWNEPFSRTPLWRGNTNTLVTDNFDLLDEDFNGPRGHFLMEFIGPRTYTVDLSSIDVGHQFTVQVVTHAFTYNRAARAVSGKGTEFETAANAWLRDPQTIGGTTVTTTGLTPIATPLPVVEPVEVPVPPAPCVPGPGPNPAAGVLQFSAANYTVAEGNTTPTITVTRTGGSLGAVTATFTTSNGSAISGTDYTPVNASVFFADGDAAPRVVTVPIIQDLISAEPDRTVNLTLSQPGGCAALGAQTTAVLTIRDDDAPPPPSRFTVGGTVTGLIGTRLVLIDHHSLTLRPGNGPFTFSDIPTLSGEAYSVRIDLQPINPTQFCTVTNGTGVFSNANVTNVVVNCV